MTSKPKSFQVPRAHARRVVSLGLILLLGCHQASRAADPTAASAGSTDIVIQPGFLPDIPGGADKATLTQAARFAWQEFIAANWPAVAQDGLPGSREKADTSKSFGDQSVPLVWHTFRSKVEIYPWLSRLPPGTSPDGKTFNYDALPQYLYRNEIPNGAPVSTAEPPEPVAWINLDETSQIGLNLMFAGRTPPTPPPDTHNSSPQLIRFLAKANRTHFDYVTSNGYYNHGGDYYTRLNNYQNALAANQPPGAQNPIIQFPSGTMMVKSAWRLLGPKDDRSHFHTTTVRFYEKKAGKVVYYQEQSWGMVALHIIVKTPTAPAFIFATFEQEENITLRNGTPLEDADGGVIGPPPGDATQPIILHTDAPPATKTIAIGKFPVPAYPDDQRLYYRELAPSLPGPGAIAVERRFVLIPDEIIAVNRQAHAAIKTYNQSHPAPNSPWQHYKLVNVQAQPFNQGDIRPPNGNNVHDSPFNSATFFQANIVVETDYTLGQFAGVLIQTGPETGQTSNFTNPGKTVPAYNVHIANGATFKRNNMGGCMGCHGNAQVAGTDFSFILNFGPVLKPDTPPATDAEAQALAQHYLISAGN